MSNILLAGSGGREHALAWSLAKSPSVERVFIAPGNPGTAAEPKCENVAIGADEVPALAEFAANNGVTLAIASGASPPALGLAKALSEAGCRVLAPSDDAARICASRAAAKQFMRKLGIATPDFAVCGDIDDALEFIHDKPFRDSGFVVKPDGRPFDSVSTSTGAFVCDTLEQAEAAAKRILVDRDWGEAGASIVIERRLRGRELSVHAFCDGYVVRMMPIARVYRRALDGDDGAVTAGMGACAPALDATDTLKDEVRSTFLRPIVNGLAAHATPFIGVLRVGIIVNRDGLHVIGIDAGFGDPEAQAILPLLASDLHDAMVACFEASLEQCEIHWRDSAGVAVVLASQGYPNEFGIGAPIEVTGRGRWGNLHVFQAGTERDADGHLVTSNGRVLTVSATSKDLPSAVERAYEGVARLNFSGMQYRTDIGVMR